MAGKLSLAFLADAGHNLSDVGGLLLAWAAFGAARLRPDKRHTMCSVRLPLLPKPPDQPSEPHANVETELVDQ